MKPVFLYSSSITLQLNDMIANKNIITFHDFNALFYSSATFHYFIKEHNALYNISLPNVCINIHSGVEFDLLSLHIIAKLHIH